MADDLDVHELLEAPYQKAEDEAKSKSGLSGNGHGRSDRDRKSRRSRSRSRDRKRSSSRDRHRHQRHHHRNRRSRSRSRDHGRHGRRSRSRDRNNWRADMTPEDRDARTVFCMQMSQRIKRRDIEEFFSSVGKVTDVRMIMCNKTRRFKGIVYVEFRDIESVSLAMGLSGQKLLGVPILVQPSQAEKNRAASTTLSANKQQPAPATRSAVAAGSMRLYIGSLHYNITEEMLRRIFEPFGKIDDLQLIMDSQTGRSKGYGFLTYRNAEDAKCALDRLNGFELAGRPMKVGLGTERSDSASNYGGGASGLLDSDEMDRAGVDLGATGRLQLMAKLAEGTGLQLPAAAASALGHLAAAPQSTTTTAAAAAAAFTAPPISTQCFMLSNMFEPNTQSATLEYEVRDNVIEECQKHGGVVHIYVDRQSPQGNVYVKCVSPAAAAASVAALHGRWFSGKLVTAAYVPLANYHSLFADSAQATQPLVSMRSQRSTI